MWHSARVVAVAVFSLLAIVSLQADGLRGRVVNVADGDTITVLDAQKRQHHVRLNGIDAPETGQAFSQVSRANLSELVADRDVIVVWDETDRYGRLIGTVLVGTTNANLEQLKAGLAWYYRQYASDVAPENRPIYEAAEAEARKARRGLWRDDNPTPPWAYRNPTSAPATAAPLVGSTPKATPTPQVRGRIIGNRNSRIYHLPGCPSYNAVAPQNRVMFNTPAEAEAAGYRKARNC